MSPNDHDFDWVHARHNCSIRAEFEKLRRDVEKATEQHKKLTRDDARFEFHDEGDFFFVQCFRGHEDETGAVFTRKNGSIEAATRAWPRSGPTVDDRRTMDRGRGRPDPQPTDREAGAARHLGDRERAARADGKSRVGER